MEADLIIRNGMVVTPEGSFPAHVAVRDGRILAMGEKASFSG